MKVRLLSVGKAREPHLRALHDDYATRIRRLRVDYRDSWVPEVRSGGRFTDEHVREREGRSILEAVASRGTVVALDLGGRSWDSRSLASQIERWAVPCATFVVGGPLGLHTKVIERADQVWSLSGLTFPHELVRVLVAEQVYRALTILRGIPYHR